MTCPIVVHAHGRVARPFATGQGRARSWVEPASIAAWLWTHHPSWAGAIPQSDTENRGTTWVINWLFGVALSASTSRGSGRASPAVCVRSAFARAGTAPHPIPAFPQTLLIQPNAEILAYRQGLTPGLIAALSRFARWKRLGPACTLELTAEQTYRGLESGLTLPMMMQTLARHSSRPIPPAVADLLQRWASKRERITVFTSAVLVEFATSGGTGHGHRPRNCGAAADRPHWHDCRR